MGAHTCSPNGAHKNLEWNWGQLCWREFWYQTWSQRKVSEELNEVWKKPFLKHILGTHDVDKSVKQTAVAVVHKKRSAWGAICSEFNGIKQCLKTLNREPIQPKRWKISSYGSCIPQYQKLFVTKHGAFDVSLFNPNTLLQEYGQVRKWNRCFCRD